ncbi:hypothetical protein QBC35DRAFT_513191 [Podospora australis]|uniref:Bromodomain associated domain-containing protein n=1 Tax=Podospora australis TaxID=1536484 RepID=A0AAN7ALI3_9PEZI|nr:hypothetical protein QBC35DRAFT_513191 [Podospora australis]
MTPPPALFHSLLRPAVLQILRATGYHAAKPAVLDTVTDLAARYLTFLCHLTAVYATNNSNVPEEDVLRYVDFSAAAQPTAISTDALFPPVPPPSIVDVRLAMQHVGAFLPEKTQPEQDYLGMEDTRGVDDFIAWAAGSLNREIQRIALDGNDEARDYLDALKKKHSKNDDDTKYLGTLLGKPHEHGGEVVVEGGEYTSIASWEEAMHALAAQKTPEPLQQPHMNGDGGGDDSRPASSGLSSLGDDIMDLSDG